MIRRIEALADSICEYNGSRDPDNVLYKLRNPGGLYAFYDWQQQDDAGRRIYGSLIHGYQSLVNDLRVKCSGQSRSGLKETSPLKELWRVFGFKDETGRYLLKFLKKALKVDVEDETPLSFFLED